VLDQEEEVLQKHEMALWQKMNQQLQHWTVSSQLIGLQHGWVV
jgi:hypothetical protein